MHDCVYSNLLFCRAPPHLRSPATYAAMASQCPNPRVSPSSWCCKPARCPARRRCCAPPAAAADAPSASPSAISHFRDSPFLPARRMLPNKDPPCIATATTCSERTSMSGFTPACINFFLTAPAHAPVGHQSCSPLFLSHAQCASTACVSRRSVPLASRVAPRTR